MLARWPRLQAVTVPTALYGGSPRVPDEDVATVGSPYRLMVRADLSRSLAAEITTAPVRDARRTRRDRTRRRGRHTPRLRGYRGRHQRTPAIHPGAIDYYEREQETFIERYESWIYLVAILGGGLGSTAAWLRQRLGRIRRERIEVATARLLELRSDARHEADRGRLEAMAGEVDDLAASIARHALNRPTEPRTLGAATVAIEAARSTVRRALGGGEGQRSGPRRAPPKLFRPVSNKYGRGQ